MKIQLANKPLSEITSEYNVLPVCEEAKDDFGVAEVKSFLKTEEKFGKLYESQLLFTPKGRFLLLGLGKEEKYEFVILQNWVGSAVKQLMKKTKQIFSLSCVKNL